MFKHKNVKLDILKKRAYNHRWAMYPNDIIPLTAADPDFPCAPEIAEAIKAYASDRYFSYTPAEGLVFFRESVGRFHTEKRNVAVSPGHVLAVDSAAYGIFLVCKAILQKGDEAIVFNPVDFLFKHSIEANSGIAVSFPIPIDSRERIDIELFEKTISDRTKIICLCNPLNPTGRVFTKDELLQIGQLAIKHNLIILSDEIWSDIVFAPNRYISIASLSKAIHEKTIIVTGYSKSYGLAGLRIGSVISPTEKLYRILIAASEHQSTVHGCNSLAQVAASTALDKCGYWLEAFVNHLHKMRKLCVDELNKISGFTCALPQSCYLLFPNIENTGVSAEALQQILLEKARVAVVPGMEQWFGSGAKGHIRISFATSEELLKEAIYKISKAVEEI